MSLIFEYYLNILQLLSQAYTKFTINNQASTSTAAIAQQANFWDPPSKSEQTKASIGSDNMQELVK